MLRVGFLQGRLSPKPEGRIQAFPHATWREEFKLGQNLGFECIELIYDDLYLEQNPLASPSGRSELKTLAAEHRVALTSICADYYMNFKLADREPGRRKQKLEHALALLEISKEIGCPLVEFPFVDSSSLKAREDQDLVSDTILALAKRARELDLRLALETDLPPVEFKSFLERFPENVGANLDLGNSAALGYDVLAECRAYGERVFNVHVKDRVLGGSTVPLTTGHTDFERAFRALKQARYRDDFILQTAPSPDYLGVAAKYQAMVRDWMAPLWN